MRVRPATWLWSLATVLAASGTAWLTARHVPHRHTPSVTSEESFHDWLHAHLDITEKQSRELAPYEHRFEQERHRLRRDIRLAGEDLAKAIREGPPASPGAASALQRLHAAQGELQRLTLEHFFTMKEHLEPAQAERLLQWTHDNILHGPAD